MTAELDFLGSLFNGSPLASSIVGASPSASGAGAAGLAAQRSLVPELNAGWVDRTFAETTQYSKSTPPVRGMRVSQIQGDGRDRSKWKDEFGWDLGGNNVGSFIKRGASAMGLERMSAQAPVYGNGEIDHSNDDAQWARDYKDYEKRLTELAGQLGLDVSGYYSTLPGRAAATDSTTGKARKTGMGSGVVTAPDQQVLDADRLYGAIDEHYKDMYLVGGMAQGLPGQTGNTGQKAVRSLYMRNGDKLVPQGDAQVYDAPENSQGFFKESILPGLPILLAPFTLGASSALAAGIQSAIPALGAAGSAAAAGALTGGTMSALTGGDVGKGMLTGGVVGGVGAGVAGSQFAGAAPFARMGAGMVASALTEGSGSDLPAAGPTAAPTSTPGAGASAMPANPAEVSFLDGLFGGSKGGGEQGFMSSLIAKGKTLGSI